jgi:hypothetical protein
VVRRIVILMLVVVLGAAACSSDGDAEDAAPDPTTTEPSSQETTTTVAAATTTTTSAASTTTEPEAVGDLASCVVGSWELDSDAFFDDLLATLPSDGQLGEFSVVGGAYRITAGADGTWVNERDGWTFLVTSEVGDLQLTIDDRQMGTWSIDGDVLSTTLEPGEPPEVSVLVDGAPVDFPAGTLPIEAPEAEFTGAAITCSGDTMTASFGGFTSVWLRV